MECRRLYPLTGNQSVGSEAELFFTGHTQVDLFVGGLTAHSMEGRSEWGYVCFCLDVVILLELFNLSGCNAGSSFGKWETVISGSV